MKPGDMVQFRRELYERVRPSDCGIWDWALGLLIGQGREKDSLAILCEGRVYEVPQGEARVPWVKGVKDEDWRSS